MVAWLPFLLTLPVVGAAGKNYWETCGCSAASSASHSITVCICGTSHYTEHQTKEEGLRAKDEAALQDPLAAQKDVLGRLGSESYDAQRQPSAPLSVNVSYVVHDVMQLNEIGRFVELQLTFYQQWQDDRLAGNSSCFSGLEIPLPSSAESEIWMPTVRITNSISSAVVSSPSKVATLTITPTGSVTYRINMMVKQGCGADYGAFPFDTITCNFVIGTWLPAAFVRVRWIDGAAIKLVQERIKLSTFAVGNYVFKDLSNPTVGGRFVAELKFHRFYMYYILTVYIPNTLIILLAWSSFWFPPDGGRVGMCLSCLMSLTLMMNGVAGTLPKVGYMKGIDLWFLVCVALTCLAFLEYAFVAFMGRMAGSEDSEMPFRVLFWRKRAGKSKKNISVKDFAAYLDKLFRVAFLLGFVVFCGIYVAIYFRRIPEYRKNYEEAAL